VADAGAGERGGGPGAEPSDADDRHPRGSEPFLQRRRLAGAYVREVGELAVIALGHLRAECVDDALVLQEPEACELGEGRGELLAIDLVAGGAEPFGERFAGGRAGTERLEQGAFPWPTTATGKAVLSPAQMSLLLEGLEWRRVQPAWRPTAV